MTDKRIGGHLSNACLHTMGEYSVATGVLEKDHREYDANNAPRDFSGADIRTSWLVRLQYSDLADTTIIETRNSIYYATGNLIKDQLDSDLMEVKGYEVITNLLEKST